MVIGLVEFSMAFFQKVLGSIKEDIMVVFKEFHSEEKSEKSFNAILCLLS
jgi:hypothetical protein